MAEVLGSSPGEDDDRLILFYLRAPDKERRRNHRHSLTRSGGVLDRTLRINFGDVLGSFRRFEVGQDVSASGHVGYPLDTSGSTGYSWIPWIKEGRDSQRLLDSSISRKGELEGKKQGETREGERHTDTHTHTHTEREREREGGGGEQIKGGRGRRRGEGTPETYACMPACLHLRVCTETEKGGGAIRQSLSSTVSTHDSFPCGCPCLGAHWGTLLRP